MKVRLTQSGWENYTGLIRDVEFEDGVSTRALLAHEIDLFAALFEVRGIEGDETDIVVGHAARVANNSLVRADVAEPLARATEEELNPTPAPAFHTEAELLDIADRQGIKGLREIAKPLDVRGRAIPELISEILAAEYKIKAQLGLVAPVPAEPTVSEKFPFTDEQHAFVDALIEEGAIVVDEEGDLRPVLSSYVKDDAEELAKAKEALEADDGSAEIKRESDETPAGEEATDADEASGD